MLLTVVAANFVLAMRTETSAVRNAISVAQAEALANGAVHRSLYEVFRQTADPSNWRPDGQERRWETDGATIEVVVMDETGKIDINTSSDALLKSLFLSVGVGEEKATQLLDAVLDWRDADSLPRPNGAERDAYRAAGLKYEPANAPFEAVEQLQQVLGMTPDIYARIAPMITVYSRQPGVNTLVASRGVLLAIPDVTPVQVDQYIEQRQQSFASGQPTPQFPAGGAYASPAINSIINVRAAARMPDGAVYVREATARWSGEARRPVAFLSWKEGRSAVAPAPQ